MEISIAEQGRQALLATAAGAGLGVFYDVLKTVRNRVGGLRIVHAVDLVFAIVAGILMFILGAGPGAGSLRPFMLFAAAAGSALYFVLISRFVRTVLRAFCDAAAFLIRQLFKPYEKTAVFLKKSEKNAKKNFKYLKKWFTIKYNTKKRTRSAGSRRAGSEVVSYEIQESRNHDEAGYPDTDSLRRDFIDRTAKQNRRSRAGNRAAQRSR